MDKQIILTAIIFTYNHKDHIAKCIESHLNQKTTYNYEIRIYDDCSNDGTTEICREYAKKYPDKIKLIVQKENTFLKSYNKMQSYKAIQDIDTKYFCIIDGDDCWCDENKIQIAIDCLENHPEYIGFAHDTNHINNFTNKEESYVHDIGKWNNFENPVNFKAVPYFFTSSRIFRNCGFKDKHIIPVDYLIYFYHASKGPIFYYDKIMANYYISEYNNFSNMEHVEQLTLLTTFGYKIAKFFNYKEDKLAMDVQAYYNKNSCKKIEQYKRLFGVKLGWNLWYLINFVPIYGFESLNLNWVCPRKLIKKRADYRYITEQKRLSRTKRCIRKSIKIRRKKVVSLNIIDFLLKFLMNLNIQLKLYDILLASKRRKEIKIPEIEKEIKDMHKGAINSKKIINKLKKNRRK